MGFDVWDFDNEDIQIDEDKYKDMIVKVKGTLARIMYPKPPKVHESGEYCIARITPSEVVDGELHPRALDKYNTISIKGDMQKLEYGDTLEFTIVLDEVHEIYGASYKLKFSREDFQFNNESDIKLFLSKILTSTQVDEMYKILDNPIEAIENGDINLLTKIKGVGEVVAQRIIDKYEASKDFASAYIELDGYGLTTEAINGLIKQYGSPETLIDKIKDNPYVLIELDGYGFKKVDKIAMSMGIKKQDIKRLIAFIDYVLLEMGNSGYSWIDSEHLITLIEENLGEDIDMQDTLKAVNILKESNKVWNEEKGKIASMKFYRLELCIVKELLRLKSGEITAPDNWEQRVLQAEKLQGYKYTDEQKEAIKSVIINPVSVIIGKAGTGKTTSVLGAVNALGEDLVISQCALSGKASARLKEATGKDSYTIHKLLEYNPKSEGEGNFNYNKDNQLPSDVVILDESSMVGGEPFLWLLEAIPTNSRFVMIGDIRQLSPVGALNVFYDVVNSGVIPVSEITKIHRQGEKSAIITESHKVSDGIQLFEKNYEGILTLGELEDLILDITKTRSSIPDKILNYFIKEVESGEDILEIQVISPLNNRGETSVYSLNKIIQEWYNPSEENKAEVFYTTNGEEAIDGYTFREGDKIMVIKNNYKLLDTEEKKTTLFNGYTGVITKITDKNIIARFPLADTENDVVLPPDFWNGKRGVVLGYVSTTAKNQGSGYNSVIYAIDNSHYMLLCRQQLYTALTRARKKMILVGENKAVINAINVNETNDKQTFMPTMLKNGG